MKLKQIHKDKRRSIHLVEDLLPEKREFTIINLKADKAIGGCLHSEKEYFVVIKGSMDVDLGDGAFHCSTGYSGVIGPETPHMFWAYEDTIVCEWGVKTTDKGCKDAKMRALVDEINGKN